MSTEDLWSQCLEASRLVGERLVQAGGSLAVAESCTGGLLGHLVTEVPGSSNYFLLGVVAYSNEAKKRILGVPEGVLEAHGAVSEPVAEAMARGVARISGSQWAVATTGIAGPGGGTPEKPVGTVYVAVMGPGGGSCALHRFGGTRTEVKLQAALAALRALLEVRSSM